MPFPGSSTSSSGPAPLPPSMSNAAAPSSQPPSMMMMAGQAAGQAGANPMTPGASQVSESAVRMSAEIDQALKLLAQAIPSLAPWVEQVTSDLRYQVGTALQSGQVPTNPANVDNSRMPDGSGRM